MKIDDQGPIMNDDQQLQLQEPVTTIEIRKVIWNMNINKSPSPDGQEGVFFRVAWDIIWPDNCDAIQKFFDNGKLLKKQNATIVTLIPKTDKPEYASLFR